MSSGGAVCLYLRTGASMYRLPDLQRRLAHLPDGEPHLRTKDLTQRYRIGIIVGMVNLKRQKLLTAAQRKALPALYANEHVADPIAIVKFFCPWNGWTWYATEFDGDDRFFGLVQGHDEELGYFMASQLASLIGPGGLGVERDIHFVPTPLSKIRRSH
jgi:hypothetical protein